MLTSIIFAGSSGPRFFADFTYFGVLPTTKLPAAAGNATLAINATVTRQRPSVFRRRAGRGLTTTSSFIRILLGSGLETVSKPGRALENRVLSTFSTSPWPNLQGVRAQYHQRAG